MAKKKKNKKNNKKNNRSERIKKACMEKTSKKNEPDHIFISKGNNKGGHCWGRSDNKSMCKITCRNKSHGGKR